MKFEMSLPQRCWPRAKCILGPKIQRVYAPSQTALHLQASGILALFVDSFLWSQLQDWETSARRSFPQRAFVPGPFLRSVRESVSHIYMSQRVRLLLVKISQCSSGYCPVDSNNHSLRRAVRPIVSAPICRFPIAVLRAETVSPNCLAICWSFWIVNVIWVMVKKGTFSLSMPRELGANLYVRECWKSSFEKPVVALGVTVG